MPTGKDTIGMVYSSNHTVIRFFAVKQVGVASVAHAALLCVYFRLRVHIISPHNQVAMLATVTASPTTASVTAAACPAACQ